MFQYKIPVLFIIFNKTEETKRVFDVIRSQEPEFLFIAADGPRPDRPYEIEKCEYIRRWAIENIDWDCEVKTLFREENIGCGRGPSEAISWFFEHVDEGIILEDDCLPNGSFFRFCEENLVKYRFDNRISIISGNNFQKTQPMAIESDYYFSVFPSSNGWATWKRTWDEYDYQIKKWGNPCKKNLLQFLFNEKKYQRWWKNQFDWIYSARPEDMWDFQFHFHCMYRKQLAIIPKANLVTNIGYGPDATHSADPNSYFANVPTHELNFPLKHPENIERNYEADLFIQQNLFGEVEIVNPWKKFKRFIKRIIRYNQ
jgi:hypothetical protein